MPTNQMNVSLLGKIAGYTELLAKDPNSTVFVPLSEAYRQMGMFDDAIEVALAGTHALPKFSPGYTALGRVYAQRGDLDLAVAAFEGALEIDDESLAALRGLARVRALRGERELARTLLQRAAALHPEDAAARKMLAGLGAPPTPPVASPVVTAKPPVPDVSAAGGPISTPTIADIYIRQGFPKRALKVYRDLLQGDPHNEEVRRKLVALKQQIDTEEAASRESPPAGTVADREPSTYARSLQSWLDAIQRRREHVQ